MNLRSFFPSSLDRTAERILQVVIAANCAMLVFYVTTTYRLLFHSDSATKNLLAEEIVRSGQFFPRDWNYVNGDLFVVFGHLFILPLIPFFKNGFALHAVSGLVSCALIIGSLWLVLKELEVSKVNKLLCIAVVTTGISPYFAESLFGQVSYGALLYIELLLVYCILRYVRKCGSNGVAGSRNYLLAIVSIVFFICLGNPQRALASFGLPLFVALVGAMIHERLAPTNIPFLARRPAVVLFGAVIFSAVIGAVAHKLVLSYLTNNYDQAASASFLEYKDVVRNFVGTIQGLLFILGGEGTPGNAVVSISGAYEALRTLLAVAMMMVPLALLMGLRRQSDPRVVMITVFAIASLAIVSFFHVFTSVPVMSDPRASARYFALPLIAVLVALFAQFDQGVASMRKELRFGWLLGFAPILAGGVLILVMPALQKPISLSGGLTLSASPFDSAVALLRSNRLQYGYATYWQAGALTVLSDGDVKVRPVLATQPPEPMRHLASNEWYRPSAYKGPTFLLLSEQEFKSTGEAYVASGLGEPERVLIVDGWRVMVYPFNIAERLSWDTPRRGLEAPLQSYKFSLRLISSPPATVTGKTMVYELEVANLGNEIYSSAGSFPVNVGVHLTDTNGTMLINDLSRAQLPGDLVPGTSQRVFVPVRIEQDGHYKVSFDLVQEGVAWFASRGGGSALEVEASAVSPH